MDTLHKEILRSYDVLKTKLIGHVSSRNRQHTTILLIGGDEEDEDEENDGEFHTVSQI